MFQKKEERFLNIKGALYNNIGGITKFVWKKPNGTPVEGYAANLYSYDFDGVNEYVTFGDVLSLERTDAFSFSFWIKPNSNNGMILGKNDSASGAKGYAVYFNTSNKLRFQLIANNSTSNWILVDSTNTVSLNEWTHVTVTYSGNGAASGVSIYLNGSLETPIVTADNLTADISNNIDFNIGARNNGNLPFNGRIDEVVYLSSELSATDVTALYNDGFPSDPASLSPSNQIRLGDGDVLVKGLDFDGINEYVTLGNVLNLFPSDSFSLSFWFNKDTATGHTIIGNRGAAGYGWQMRINGNVLYFQFITSGGTFYFEGGTVSLSGTWNHALITYDGSSSSAGGNIYLNGVDDLSAASGTGSGTWAAKELTIGATAGTAPRLNGQLFTVAYFDSVLTSGNAVTLYNGGIPKLATALGLSPNNEWDLAKKFTKSLTFDGVNEYINFGNNLDQDGSSAFSISLWFNPSTVSLEALISKYVSNSWNGYTIYIQSSKIYFILGNNTSNVIQVNGSTTLLNNTLYHLVLTYDGSKNASGVNIYLNNSSETLTPLKDTFTLSSSNTDDLNIGRFTAGNLEYEGEILNVSFFNSELTAGNVTTLYNGGVPNTATNLGLTPTNEWDIYNEDVNYFDGTNHVIVDQAGSINGASVNMELVDITDVFWAVTDEVGSLNGTSVNMEEIDEVVVGWIADDITGSADGISVNMEETDRKLGVLMVRMNI
jgi:hypothetical protein